MKDAKGHGSNPRGTLQRLGIPLGADYHTLSSSKAQELADEAKRQGYRKPDSANGSTGRYFHDRLQRQAAKQSPSGDDAAGALAGGGAKSAPVPTHDSMGYSPDAVNKAIASSNRAGRRIGGKEARAIHALLRGRH
jgi:hypothetical protein